MSSETPKIAIDKEPENTAAERIAAAIAAPDKLKRKYTASDAKLEQLKMAREKAAAAKALAKKAPAPTSKAQNSEIDLKAQIAEAVAAALKAQPKKPKTKAMPAARQPPPTPPPRPSREETRPHYIGRGPEPRFSDAERSDLLMKIIRGY